MDEREITIGAAEQRAGWEVARALVLNAALSEWAGMTADGLPYVGFQQAAADDPVVLWSCCWHLARWARGLNLALDPDDDTMELLRRIADLDEPTPAGDALD